MLQTVELTKRYGDLVAVDRLSLRVDAGEIVGFLGPNGAGKTTCMRLLTGFLPATAGQAFVAGHSVTDDPLAVRRHVGYLPEVAPLYPDLTVEEMLRFVGALKGLGGRAQRGEVDRALARVDLGASRRRLIRNLSKGTQQRVGLALALLGNPPVLILDEPTVGLDPRQIGEVRALIRELAGDHTILLSTHILQEVVATCDRVAIISRGRLVADAPLAELLAGHRPPRRVAVGGGHGAAVAPAAAGPATLEQIFLSLTEA